MTLKISNRNISVEPSLLNSNYQLNTVVEKIGDALFEGKEAGTISAYNIPYKWEVVQLTPAHEELAKAHAIATYTCSHDMAEDYDIFVSMESFDHEQNDFEICEPFEDWDYESIKELLEIEYRSILGLIKKAVEL